MRIAHVISTFPPRFGGMGEICSGEVERLKAAGHEVTVFTMRYSKEIVPNFFYPVIRLRPWLRFGDGGLVPQLFWLLRGFDVVHLHYPFYISAHFVWLAKIFWHQKYIVTYHMDAQSAGWVKILQKIYDFFWTGIILRGAERVIVVDKANLAQFRNLRRVSAEKIVEIANAVDAEIFKPQEKNFTKLGLENLSAKKIVLFVANLMPVKRLDLAIEAIKKLSEDVVLLVVGGGYAEENYKKMARELGLEKRVIFVGSCADKQKLAAYCALSSVVAVPSDYESFSLSTICAMSCEVPVVGSNVNGIKERITDGVDGFLFTPGSASDLAEKINRVLNKNNSEWQAMGAAGRKKVLENYTWGTHMKKIVDLYS